MPAICQNYITGLYHSHKNGKTMIMTMIVLMCFQILNVLMCFQIYFQPGGLPISSHKILHSGPILAVCCVRLSHAFNCTILKYFQILYIFAQIFKYVALFQHFLALFLQNRTYALITIQIEQALALVNPPLRPLLVLTYKQHKKERGQRL